VPLKRTRRGQNIFLCLASLFFYAWGEPWFVLVLMVSIASNWGFGILASHYGRPEEGQPHRNLRAGRELIVCMSVFNLGILFCFKYLDFAVQNLDKFLHLNIPDPGITLPIGISFFTFHAMSYVIDIFRGISKAQKNPLDVGLYISFFPQLIAGPIIRFHTIADQIYGRKESLALFSEGARRFIVGLAKKVIIANSLALVADSAFSAQQIGSSPVLYAWIGAIAYTLQIYYDFSGYSDMAIGLGRMFGFRFPENFDYPYISKSTSEFWRRWHMSLGMWFRDYVYFPLGGSRVRNGRLVFNLFVVWFLTGVWHGANWTFIFWGLLFFCTISFEKLTKLEHREWAQRPAAKALRHIFTMLFIVLGWVLFRSDHIGPAFTYIGNMFGLYGNPLSSGLVLGALRENAWFFGLGLLFSAPLARDLGRRIDRYFESGRTGMREFASYIYTLAMGALYMLVFVMCISYLVKGSYNPFIYFNF